MNVYSTYSDKDLLLLLKKSDHLAYTEIYDRYNGLLYVFAYKRIKNREEVRDSIHELFLKIWADREAISPDIILPAYLYRSLRNRLINIVAHQKIEAKYIESFHYFASQMQNNACADDLVRHNQLNKLIEREIAALHPRMKTVFELSRNENMSRKEIAEKLSISEETVKSHMHGALKILRMKLSTFIYSIFYFF